MLFASAAKKRGFYIVAVAVKGDTSFALQKYVDKIYWLGLGEFSKLFELFKREGISKVVMAGQVSPRRLFSKEVNKDEGLRNLLESVKDKKADTIFGAIALKLKECGLELLDSTTFIEEFIPPKGTLTKREPDIREWGDINFGLTLAKQIAALDIGQSVIVKDKAVVAVEALEGTDNIIRRAKAISRGGFVLVKVSKPNQDKRFDIPVVGLRTVRNLAGAKAKCLAIEAGKTLFIDKQESIKLADKKSIAIVAV